MALFRNRTRVARERGSQHHRKTCPKTGQSFRAPQDFSAPKRQRAESPSPRSLALSLSLSLSLSLFHSPFLPLSFSLFLFLAHMDNTLFNGPKVLEPFGRTETLASTRRDPSACSQNTNTNMLVSCASNVSSLVLVSRKNSAGVLYHGHKKRCNVCPLACPDRT